MIEIPPWTYIANEREADILLQHIENTDLIAIDTETTGLIRHIDEVVFWSMSDGVDRWALPAKLLGKFKRYLQDPGRNIIGHNLNYDTWMCRNSGLDLLERTPRYHFRRRDTMVMHCLFEDDAPEHGLKYVGPDVICSYNGEPRFHMPGFKETFGKGAKISDTASALLNAPIEVTADYASLDAWVTFWAHEEMKWRLQERTLGEGFAILMGLPTDRTYNLWDYYTLIEAPLHDILYRMEEVGMLIDPEHLQSLAEPMQKQMDSISRRISKACGKVINVNSHPQLRWVFFDPEGPFGLDPIKLTDGGKKGIRKPSTDADVLEEVAFTNKTAQDVLDFRAIRTLKSTFIDGLLNRLDSFNRVHTQLNQHVARTGRLSSSDPNLQNIPVRSEEGRKIRQAFIAPEGKILMVCDEEQLEARITAGLCKDPKMCRAIQNGMDYHSNTASLMFGVNYDDIIKAKAAKKMGAKLTAAQKDLLKKRRVAKTIGFALLYGAGDKKLAKQLKVAVQDAKSYSHRYHDAYPAVQVFFNKCIGLAEKTEVITTLLGRRRNLKGIRSPEWRARTDDERKATNTPIQGTAAEIMKLAMLRVYLDNEIWDSGARMTMQVHDEIIMECPEGLQDEPWFNDRIRTYMAHPFEVEPFPLPDGTHLPLDADPGWGYTWIDAK
jgi:DNA polymerase-1